MHKFVSQFHDLYGTATLVDAAFRARVDFRVTSSDLNPVSPRHKLAGPIVPLQANNDLIAVLEAVHIAAEGQVIVINNAKSPVGILGDIIATEAKRKMLGGFIVDGLVRDVPTLLDLGLAVICRGSTPMGPLKLDANQRGIGQVQVPVEVGGVTVAPGDWAFGDADGVVFLCSDDLARVFEQAATTKTREDDLFADLANGHALSELLQLEAFLEQRRQNPNASFNDHLNQIGRAL